MHNLKTAELHIHHIGSVAGDVLDSENTAMLFCNTSRGIFLLFKNNRMIFLSFENFRGPLTANLSGEKQVFSNLSRKETIIISRHGIHFPDSGIRISTANAKVWDPSLPAEKSVHQEERNNLIRQLALDVYQSKGEVGMSRMLPTLVGNNQGEANLNKQFKGLRIKIDKTRNQLSDRDWIRLTETLLPLLGMGSGLTPSGDDFIIGLLLSINRWGSVLLPGDDLSILNKNLVEAAYRDTTTLSANLIECAALGLADERLIQANDYLAVGNYQLPEISSGLLNWGNSSGVDALVGMITAFDHS